MTTSTDNHQCWVVDLDVKGHSIAFKLDTGAEVTAITDKINVTNNWGDLSSANPLEHYMGLLANPSMFWANSQKERTLNLGVQSMWSKAYRVTY